MEYPDLPFWPAPVRLHPFEDHVRAASAGGFTSLAITTTTYADARARGMSAPEMRSMAEGEGAPLKLLDTLGSWAPIQLGAYTDAEINERCRAPVQRALEICDELGLQQILAVSAYEPDGVALSRLVEGFADLCDRAGELGIWVDLEPMPFAGCKDIADAVAILHGADRRNCGIMMDSWHFFKAGQTLDVLADVPGRYLRTMQINDAPLRQITDSLIEDTIKFRDWPGQGELPLTDFIQAVHAKGHLAAVGQEVFSLAADRMSPEEAGRLAGETTRAALRRAGIPVRSKPS